MPGSIAPPLRGIDAAILVGGLGTRLQSILPDRPKALALIDGRMVIDRILDFLVKMGVERAVLCLGHRADQILAHFQAHPRTDLALVPSVETHLLGTAGAIRHARPLLKSDPVLVLNGDTLVDADLSGLVDTHRRQAGGATLVCTRVKDASRFGSIEIDNADWIVAFREKADNVAAPGWINAGLYLFSASWLDALCRTAGPSLEKDVFQTAPAGSLAAFRMGKSFFIDIGTPESLQSAQRCLKC